jgi:hypothetical protein
VFRDSRFDLDTIAFVVVVVLLVAGGAWILMRNERAVSSGASQTVSSASPSAAADAGPSASPSPSASPATTTGPATDVKIRVTAPLTDTWVEVRKSGPKGRVLFSGVVKAGNTRVFAGDLLWLRLRDPAKVRLRIYGRKIVPGASPGPVDYLIKNGKLERQG